MKLREIGEFELIERMARVFGPGGAVVAEATTAFSRLSVGIGDDAAVWQESAGCYTVATTDAMVEGVHFTRATTDWYDLGWKAMTSNVSDIAGMGCVPRYALVALGATSETDVDEVLELCRGMRDLASRFGVSIVGGDTVSSPVAMITITLLGETQGGARADGSPPLLSRFAARPGDLIAVTGQLGSSAGGLELLLHRRAPIPERYSPLLEAHRRPLPRVEEGLRLVESGVRCGMDLSDGLVGDLTRICRASGVSVQVEVGKLPIHPLLRERFGERAVELALSGGEDYELLCTAPAETVSRARLLLHAINRELTAVGVVQDRGGEPPHVMLVDETGRRYEPKRSGWEHFAADEDATASG
jgi:thiamine-monophosphate kinase